MPPMPTPYCTVKDADGFDIKVFRVFQLCDYARTYAAEQVRELVEALERIASQDRDDGDEATHMHDMADIARALIAKHRGQPK